MHSDKFGAELQMAWQSQKTVSSPFVSSLLRRAAWQHRVRFQIDRASATILHGVLALYFGAAALFGDVFLCRLGSAVFSAGLAYALVRFLCDGTFSAMPPEKAAETDCLEYYREQLIRRSRAAERYLGSCVFPTVPGALLGIMGWIMAEPREWVLPVGILALFLGFQYVATMHQKQLGAQLKREIALLDRPADQA